MKLFKWAEEKINKMNIWEFALLKLCLVLLGIIIGSFIATFVQKYLLYLIALFAAGYIILLWRIFMRK